MLVKVTLVEVIVLNFNTAAGSQEQKVGHKQKRK